MTKKFPKDLIKYTFGTDRFQWFPKANVLAASRLDLPLLISKDFESVSLAPSRIAIYNAATDNIVIFKMAKSNPSGWNYVFHSGSSYNRIVTSSNEDMAKLAKTRVIITKHEFSDKWREFLNGLGGNSNSTP